MYSYQVELQQNQRRLRRTSRIVAGTFVVLCAYSSTILASIYALTIPNYASHLRLLKPTDCYRHAELSNAYMMSVWGWSTNWRLRYNVKSYCKKHWRYNWRKNINSQPCRARTSSTIWGTLHWSDYASLRKPQSFCHTEKWLRELSCIWHHRLPYQQVI